MSSDLAYYLYHAHTKGSHSTYNSPISSFEKFAKVRNAKSYPATPLILAEYAVYRAENRPWEKSMKADTILSAMSAIRWAHIIRQQPIDAFSSPLIKLTIDGIRRVQGNYGKRRQNRFPRINSEVSLPLHLLNLPNSLKSNLTISIQTQPTNALLLASSVPEKLPMKGRTWQISPYLRGTIYSEGMYTSQIPKIMLFCHYELPK